MPTYRFRNKTTGKEFDHFVRMDDKETYMKENNLESVIVPIGFVHQAGSKIPVDNGFREVQDKIAQTHRNHNMKRH